MNWQDYIPNALFLAALVVFVIYINIVNRERRAAMTPEERKAADEEFDAENFW